MTDRNDMVELDWAWFRAQAIEGVRIFFAPFVGAAIGFWRGVTYGMRQGAKPVR